MIAKALRKPFYVAVESYKFARMYPLSQRDVADMMDTAEGSSSTRTESMLSSALHNHHPEHLDWKGYYPHSSIDFTPAQFITLLFTDLGVLTPAAVSDELIRLYQ
jgi:translation initiation factor eIF-2B subunit alpha